MYCTGEMRMRKITESILFCMIIALGLSGMTQKTVLYAAEPEVLEDSIPAGDETSAIWPMNDLVAIQLGEDKEYKANPINDYKSLKTPAQITQQGNYYFIVDTYNDQILNSSDVWKPINEWRVMDRKLNKPHAIASDGQMYLVADTDNNRVLCYEYVNGRFQNTQRFDHMGTRPHYIQYDIVSESFFIWSSLTGDMYIVKKVPGYNYMYIKEIRHIYELEGFYVRSFSIEEDEVIFPSGNNCYMIVADRETLRVKERYAVTPEISGMASVKKIERYYYITVSTDETLSHKGACIIRTPDLHTLSEGIYENITPFFKDMKVPYYIDRINGSYYVTSHESKKSIYHFDIMEDMPVNVYSVK